MVADFRILPDAEAVARAAAEYLGDEMTTCINNRGICHVALPGGSTPARCLELLSGMQLPWSSIHWYLGDERCYPVGHPQRNDSMIAQQLWSKIKAPAENQHPIPAELGPELAAEKYSELIQKVGSLDIVVLGMGEDGHTASLFPHNAALQDTHPVVPVFDAPKPPGQRVSLSLATIQSASQRVILVAGSGKREALARVKQGIQLPVSLVGSSLWFVDNAAAAISDNMGA